jgi:transcriptional regulator with XRE-family HTH domain
MSIVPYSSSGFVSAVPPSMNNDCIEEGNHFEKDALSSSSHQKSYNVNESNSNSLTLRERTKYHRIGEVRAEQGVSLRSVSRRTGIEIRILKQQEDPYTNLTIQELQVWQRALDVPLADLLVDNNSRLSQPVQQRAQLVKIMKTTAAIQEVSTSPRVNRLVTMLKEQLEELMPELKEVSAWPNYGQRRAPNQLGKIGEMPIITSHLSLDLGGE